jgi:hypothetical protein
MSAAGQEATIVGVTSVMRPDDYLIGTYRAQPRGAQVGRREATLRAAPAAPRPRRRARARRRAAERHPAPTRHANLGTTSVYLQGIDTEEIIATVHARRAPMMSASAGLQI